MIAWGAFADEEPELAASGRELLYQFGVGLAFLATTRADGAPRVHPMCPVQTDDALYAFIVPSPKRNDLRRDGRFAMHSFPADENEDAFFITGHARSVEDRAIRSAVMDRYREERKLDGPPDGGDTWQLFEFLLDSCMLTRTAGHGDPAPQHTTWKVQP